MFGKKLYFLSVVFSSGGGAPLPAVILLVEARAEPLRGTILFVAVSAAPGKLATDWAEDCDKIILRRCPVCKTGFDHWSRTAPQAAHDEHHDWIWIHRGRCADCGTTFTSFRCFLFLTRISVCGRVARRCCGALRSTVRGRRHRPS